ncbi:hypothetical protein LCGC14_2018560 [marine sediment metagenome]|uniref:HPt domain-containing protein n=1 Tax=marine sediment metagenome TaxID=412755 RepID=A0A0F9EY86_9ZZZZ
MMNDMPDEEERLMKEAPNRFSIIFDKLADLDAMEAPEDSLELLDETEEIENLMRIVNEIQEAECVEFATI